MNAQTHEWTGAPFYVNEKVRVTAGGHSGETGTVRRSYNQGGIQVYLVTLESDTLFYDPHGRRLERVA